MGRTMPVSSELFKQVTLDLQSARDELCEARKEWEHSIGQMNHSTHRLARAQIAVSRAYSLLVMATGTMPIPG